MNKEKKVNSKPAAGSTTKIVKKKKIIIKKIHHAPSTEKPPVETKDKVKEKEEKVFSKPTPPSIPVVSLPKIPPKQETIKKPEHKERQHLKWHDYESKKEKFKDDVDITLQYHKKREEERVLPKEITILERLTVGELARKLNLKASELIKKLMDLGVLATITDIIDSDTAIIVAEEYGVKVKVASLYEETLVKEEDYGPDDTLRDPIVTVMGHVDHGKTHLLDTIRKTNVRETEAGLITQHIGAYKIYIDHNGKKRGIVFLDTPGHEAFTSMRARGAKLTDIVVLVVAADDGVMPQTIEALHHAKDASVPIIVAINKIDITRKNVEKIKQDLSKEGIVPEEWGGENIFVEISAKENIGIDRLLDTILLVYDLHEKKANPKRPAIGTIIESRIDPGFGPCSTVLIQNGTLYIGNTFVAGIHTGKVKTMHDENGVKLTEAGPSTPVVISGIDGLPDAGDPFQVVKSERYARQISDKRKELKKLEEIKNIKKVTLSNYMEKISEGEIKELPLIIKADVKGSIEALEYSFNKLSSENNKVKIKIIHSASGSINKNDVLLAAASKAIIIGFHVRPDNIALGIAEQRKVEIRTYEIIYDAIEDVKKAMEGVLEAKIVEEVIGRAEIRQIFKISKVGNIAGCMVVDGKIQRNAKIRVIREGKIIYTTSIATLKHFKDDVKEVTNGMECGILLENFNDIKINDILEAFIEKKETQKLFS